MNSSIISADAARELDGLAQTINPILFWTCNFEPTISYAISEDGRFFTGIQDLYKFAVDANCVLKSIAFNSKSGICPNLLSKQDAGILRSIVETVQMLRAVFDHNHSDLNGKVDSDELYAYRGWIRSKLDKDEPVAQEDFAVLNAALGDMGADLIRLSEQVITCIKGRQDVDAITERWIEKTLQWYCTGTRQNYYRGQLCSLYYAKGCEYRSNFSNKVDDIMLKGKVNHWIKNQATREFDVEIRELTHEYFDIKGRIDNPSPLMIEIRSKSPEQYEKAVEALRCRLSEIEVKKKEIEVRRSQFEQDCHLKYDNKISYFFDSKRFYERLRGTLKKLRDTGEVFTLLPQDFLYFDIMYNFEGARVPDEDFSPL